MMRAGAVNRAPTRRVHNFPAAAPKNPCPIGHKGDRRHAK
jgi:hypothetical protein